MPNSSNLFSVMRGLERPGDAGTGSADGAAERFQNILNGLPQMVWANEPGGKHYYNRKWFDFTGVDSELPLERLSLVHPEDREQAQEAWQSAQRAGLYEAEYRLRHKSGEYRWVVSRGSPERDHDGHITAWFGTCTNIHDRWLAREALARSEALNRTVVESSYDPMFLVGPDRRVLFINEAAKKALFSPDAASLMGRDIIEAYGDIGRERGEHLLAALRGERNSVTIERLGPDGRPRFWDLALTPVFQDGEVVAALLVARNITELTFAERKLKAMQQELIYASRKSAMGTMAATLAHELNQPLTAITNYSAALRRLANSTELNAEDISGAAASIGETALRAGEIIRRMRSMANGETIPASEVEVAPVVQDVVQFAELGQGVAVELQLDGGIFIMVDVVQLQQVLLNLIKNACQAMSTTKERLITVSAKAVDRFARLCVSDTGPGVPENLIGIIFEADMTTKDQGMGIGLSISRTIVEAHGGRIWAENQEKGARFCVELPLATPM